MDWNNYVCEGQMNLFDFIGADEKFKVPKDMMVYLIETFAGIGSQAMALKRLGIPFVHHRMIEIDRFAVDSYNAIHGTHFEPTDITKVTGLDLDITNTDKNFYILTYSFPCQDLSVAGYQRGMSEDSGTRSSLLWHIGRILDECECLPQMLLMENVTQVHGKKNMDDFQKWLNRLEWMGYKNYWQDLNAKDYGVAQNRNRCFCVSILSDKGYEFPKPIPLNKTMADYLDDEVDEKYYVNNERADKLIRELEMKYE